MSWQERKSNVSFCPDCKESRRVLNRWKGKWMTSVDMIESLHTPLPVQRGSVRIIVLNCMLMMFDSGFMCFFRPCNALIIFCLLFPTSLLFWAVSHDWEWLKVLCTSQLAGRSCCTCQNIQNMIDAPIPESLKSPRKRQVHGRFGDHHDVWPGTFQLTFEDQDWSSQWSYHHPPWEEQMEKRKVRKHKLKARAITVTNGTICGQLASGSKLCV